MYAMLLPFSSVFHVSPDQLRQQLEREYELQIDIDTDFPVEFGTMEERKRALFSVCLAHMARLPPHERWARPIAMIVSAYTLPFIDHHAGTACYGPWLTNLCTTMVQPPQAQYRPQRISSPISPKRRPNFSNANPQTLHGT